MLSKRPRRSDAEIAQRKRHNKICDVCDPASFITQANMLEGGMRLSFVLTFRRIIGPVRA
jgi:hypothetical protein